MAVPYIIGHHGYGSIAACDAYLNGSVTASAVWIGVSKDNKKRANISAFRLLERLRILGSPSALSIASADVAPIIAAGGSGYAKENILTLTGGTFGEAAKLRVSSETGGVVDGVELIHAGTYTDGSDPGAAAATSSSPAGGTGCTITLTYIDQIAQLPRTGLVDCDGNAIEANVYPQGFKDAQFELAFFVHQKPKIMEAAGIGSNVKAVGAGSAKVEFFKADGSANTRFPTPVHELIRCFLAGQGSAFVGGHRGGAENASTFDGWPSSYDLNRGY